MKVVMYIVVLFISISSLHSQAPNTPVPKTYEECERIATNFRVCKRCDDKEMTKNCKEYWCQDNGDCSEAPLRPGDPRHGGITNIKTVKFTDNDTTSRLWDGITSHDSKLILASSLTPKLSPDKKTVTIYRMINGKKSLAGAVACVPINKATNTCQLEIAGKEIKCKDPKQCKIAVTTDEGWKIAVNSK